MLSHLESENIFSKKLEMPESCQSQTFTAPVTAYWAGVA